MHVGHNIIRIFETSWKMFNLYRVTIALNIQDKHKKITAMKSFNSTRAIMIEK